MRNFSKKYETCLTAVGFGAKVSIVLTKKSVIIVGAYCLEKKKYDGLTLERTLGQCEQIRRLRLEVAIANRGYKDKRKIGETEIQIPEPPMETMSKYEKRKEGNRFRRRASIEPVIGHLKTDNRLSRNFLKGTSGDQINVMLAAAVFNFRKWIRKVEKQAKISFSLFYKLIGQIFFRLIAFTMSLLLPEYTF